MKSSIFFLCLAGMFGGAIYLAAEKLGFNISFLEGGSIPSTEWQETLPGKWKFKDTHKTPREIWIVEGEVEYLPNGKFHRFITIKFYHDGNEPEIENSDLQIVAGGSVDGTWQIDTINEVWTEKITSCDIINSLIGQGYNEKYDGCSWYSIGSTWYYGNHSEKGSQSKISSFSRNRIDISEIVYSNGGDTTKKLERIK